MTHFTQAELRERNNKHSITQRTHLAYKQFLVDQRPQVFVTLTANRGSKSMDYMKEKLAIWDYHIDSMLNKRTRNLSELPTGNRVTGWFFHEKLETNSHWHGTITLPQKFKLTDWRMLQFTTIFNHHWKKIIPSGNVTVKRIYDTGGITGYCMKESYKGDDFFGSLVELADFWPVSKPGQIR